MAKTRVHKAGVFFDCAEHNASNPPVCPGCGAALVVVGIGNAMVQNAVWLRCRTCSKLWMKRRGEVVETRPRSGFERYA